MSAADSDRVDAEVPVMSVAVADLPSPVGERLAYGFGVTELAPLEPVGEVRVTTGRSVWLIRSDRYMRMPVTETPRPADDSIGGRMDDSCWHDMRAAWWCRTINGQLRVRILPEVGPQDGAGIVTSPVTEWCER